MNMNQTVTELALEFENRLASWIIQDVVFEAQNDEWAVAFRSLCDQVYFAAAPIQLHEWNKLLAIAEVYNEVEEEYYDLTPFHALVIGQ